MDIHFDGDQWLSQFKSVDPLLVKVVLATEPSVPGDGKAQGMARLRELVLDPVYQLK